MDVSHIRNARPERGRLPLLPQDVDSHPRLSGGGCWGRGIRGLPEEEEEEAARRDRNYPVEAGIHGVSLGDGQGREGVAGRGGG
jgi:hypothetical protein